MTRQVRVAKTFDMNILKKKTGKINGASLLTGITARGNRSIIPGSTMKTAISIEDGLLHDADKTARQMGLSRSRLFALAVDAFLQQQRKETMLVRLNEVYSGKPDPAEKRLLNSTKAKVRPVLKERW